MIIREARPEDRESIWRIIGPVIRASETYALPNDMAEDDALAYWLSPSHAVFVAEEDGVIIGTYYLRKNQLGGGAHVANCGYMTSQSAMGRGVARDVRTFVGPCKAARLSCYAVQFRRQHERASHCSLAAPRFRCGRRATGGIPSPASRPDRCLGHVSPSLTKTLFAPVALGSNAGRAIAAHGASMAGVLED